MRNPSLRRRGRSVAWQRRQLGLDWTRRMRAAARMYHRAPAARVAPRAPAVGAQQEAQAIREHQMRSTRGMRKRVQMRRRAADCRDWVPASIVVRKETRIVARRFQFQEALQSRQRSTLPCDGKLLQTRSFQSHSRTVPRLLQSFPAVRCPEVERVPTRGFRTRVGGRKNEITISRRRRRNSHGGLIGPPT